MKTCLNCGREFQERGKDHVFCSKDCSLKNHEANKRRRDALPLRNCRSCGAEYKPNSGSQFFCTRKCRLNTEGKAVTNSIYKRISGNWALYFGRLIGYKHRRKDLSVSDLMELFQKQGGKCALTGWDLTCKLERGIQCPTNASVDQIVPAGGYSKENIRLTCVCANKFRGQLMDGELLRMCSAITRTLS